jgi:hypothetical protein
MIAKPEGAIDHPATHKGKVIVDPEPKKTSDLYFDSKPEDLSAQMEEGFDRLFTRIDKRFDRMVDRMEKSFDRMDDRISTRLDKSFDRMDMEMKILMVST